MSTVRQQQIQMGECQSACQITEDTKPPFDQSIAVEYNGDRFIITEGITFEKQTTFGKVQQAARSFCQKNNISLFHIPLISRIIAYRHEFIFEQIWKRLTESQREDFLQDLNSVSHDMMDSFYYHFVVKKLQSKQQRELPREIHHPKVTRENQISNQQKIALRRYGQQLLKTNRAIVLMCAGSSTRFEDGDKFLAPFSIGKRKSCILELLMLRLRRNTGGNRQLPIIVNCNENNSNRIQKYFKEKKHFGFNPTRFRFGNSYPLAVFDHNGKYCLSQDMKLLKRPSGTAACAQSLLSPGISKFLRNERVQFLYFSGAENLLQNPGDPLFLGIMLCERRRLGVKCVGQNYENEVLPRFWRGQKGLSLLKSQDINRIPTNVLLNLPVAMNSLVVELDWLTQIVSDYNSSLFLAERYHVLTKVQKVYNIKTWKTEKRQCFSFEKDIRDLVGCVTDPILYRVSRSVEYAPVWTRGGQYCLDSAVQHFGEKLRVQLEVQLA